MQPQRLHALETDDAIIACLRNKHLRQMIEDIDEESDDAEARLRAAMGIPIFAEFANECLRVCGVLDDVVAKSG